MVFVRVSVYIYIGMCIRNIGISNYRFIKSTPISRSRSYFAKCQTSDIRYWRKQSQSQVTNVFDICSGTLFSCFRFDGVTLTLTSCLPAGWSFVVHRCDWPIKPLIWLFFFCWNRSAMCTYILNQYYYIDMRATHNWVLRPHAIQFNYLAFYRKRIFT